MRRFLWPCVIILAIVTLLGGAAGIVKALFGSRFDAQVADMKAKGEPLTVAEIIGPPVPDDRNAAVVFMQIDALQQSGSYDDALKTLDEFTAPYVISHSDADWKAAEMALAKMEPLRLLADQALARPECRFEVDRNEPLSTLFQQFPALRNIVAASRASALVNAREGRMDMAVEDIRTPARIARILEKEPMLINHLMRMSFLSRSARTACDVAGCGSLNERQARELFGELGKLDIAQSARRGWMGERAVALHYSDPKYLRQMLTTQSRLSSVHPAAGNALYGTLSAVYGQTALKGDIALYLKYTGAQLESSGLTYREAKARGIADNPQDLPFYAVFSQMFSPNFSYTTLRRYGTEADVALAKTLLAAVAYKDRFGTYPSSLHELKSRLGWRLPRDPFSGVDLIYKLSGKAFIVYSVGPDLKDDGGYPTPDNQLTPTIAGDLVVGLKR